MNSKGFTLLELILSLTILAVIVVIVSGGLRLGIRAWEKGGKMTDAIQRERISAELMKRQISSLYIPNAAKEKKNTEETRRMTFFFKGDKKRLSFLSTLPIVPGNQSGTVYAVYAVRSAGNAERLIFYEKKVSLFYNIADISDIDFHDLIPEIYSVEFEYLKDDGKWIGEYDSEIEKMPPKAVRIAIRRSEDSHPMYIIARILQTPGNENKQ